MTKQSDIQIYDNPKLQIINLPTSQIRLQYNSTYTGNLMIVNNNPNITVNLPNLAPTVAGSISVGNVSSLSIPSLALVNGSISITNSSFPSLSAPQLQTIIGDLNISGASQGTAFPSLKRRHELIRTASIFQTWLTSMVICSCRAPTILTVGLSKNCTSTAASQGHMYVLEHPLQVQRQPLDLPRRLQVLTPRLRQLVGFRQVRKVESLPLPSWQVLQSLDLCL